MRKDDIIKLNLKSTGQMGVYEFAKNAYTVYGHDIMGAGYQTGRAFVDIKDGLKISYRHYIQMLLQGPKKLTKTQAFLGEAMKEVHFHGTGPDEIYALALNYHMVDVQGNAGSCTMTSDMAGSAARYTEVMLKPEIRAQLEDLMPYVPEETTITNYKEKRYIPTPIPLSLIAGSKQSMGVGMRSSIPAFTAKSLLEAYLSNDPKKLRPSYGYSLGKAYDEESSFDGLKNKIAGKDLSNNKPSKENIEALNDLWATGKGKLFLSIPLYKCTVNSSDGFMLVCDPQLFKPKDSKKITEWKEAGYIEEFDYSDEVGKMFYCLTPRTKAITKDDLKNELIENVQTQSITYEINVATETISGPIGMYSWIDYTYKNYNKLYETYRADHLSKLDFEEIMWYNFRAIADRLYDKKKKWTDKEIAEAVNIILSKGSAEDKKHLMKAEHATMAAQKSLNTLRNADDKKELEKIAKERKQYESFKVEDKIEHFLSQLA